MSNFCFFYWCFTYCSKNWLNNFLQIFQNCLEKNFKILIFLIYFIVKIFIYFIQNLSRPYEKFTFIFYKLKNFSHFFKNFVEFLLFFCNFLKFFPQFIQNSSSFSEHFLKICILKICLNIAWKCYEYTNNVVRISYTFFWHFWTVNKFSSLEYFIKFFLYKFF